MIYMHDSIFGCKQQQNWTDVKEALASIYIFLSQTP
jgi:hypothetical protein